MEKNTGKKVITQGKLRENTGNFISAGMWPPCQNITHFFQIQNIIGKKLFINKTLPVRKRLFFWWLVRVTLVVD